MCSRPAVAYGVRVTNTPPSAQPDNDNDTVVDLERVVEDQRREIEGLRTALRHRAVIEQAKGVLTAVTGETPEVAFRRLIAGSQNTNTRLGLVAAGIVEQAIRMPAAQRPGSGGLFDEPAAGAREARLTASALSGASDATELARRLMRELADLEVVTVTMAANTSDGALRLLAYEGVGAEAAGAWQRIPLSADVPLADAVVAGKDVFLRDQQARFERYPGSRRIAGRLEASASLPLRAGVRCVGVLGLGWNDPVDFDAALRGRLRAIADHAAPHVATHAVGVDGQPLDPAGHEMGLDTFTRRLVDILAAPIALFTPLAEGDRLIDLVLEHANTQAAADLDLSPGGHLLPRHPHLARGGLFERARQVLNTGVPSAHVGTDDPSQADTIAHANLAPAGTLLLATWQPAPTRRDL